MNYSELCVTTNFTFLTGASHPEEMITRAAELGLSAIAITDRNSLAGVVSGEFLSAHSRGQDRPLQQTEISARARMRRKSTVRMR